jgi:redox-sensitive bicupin YhaK (pirin superfamily)
MKIVKSVYRADKVDMGGVVVDQPLPKEGLSQIDPFLLIHHWYQKFPGDQKQKHLGVGPHPHRGFSPVTIIFKGALHHRDSLGNSSVVGQGGVQWMNVGKGITHSERPSKEIAEEGGEFEIIQFWINTPASHKMDAAEYIPLDAEQIPVVSLDDKGSVLNLIAGEYEGERSAVKTPSELLVATLDTKAGSDLSITVPDWHNTLLYQLDGRTEINERKLGAKSMIVFENEGEEIKVNSLDNTRLLLLSGKALNEKVTSYGPFVMNTTTEIMEAIRDAQQGKLGVLIEEFD